MFLRLRRFTILSWLRRVQRRREFIADFEKRRVASEALCFTKIKLGSLQGFLCPLPVSDVLDRTEHLVGSSRRLSFHSP